jgi:pyruvate, orthophosphate dikinase
MPFEPRRYVYDFDAPPSDDPAELTRLLGGKGANLAVMANDLGLPVPPGFTITTQACNEYLRGRWPEGLDGELRDHMDRLGERVGRRFGDAADPLLVSVRSGAPVSMPGMMDTILNLGLNDATTRGLARAASGGDEFAADCLRRFRDGFRAVIGVEDVPDDPWAQLRNAVEAVFRSWNSERAQAYRRHESIADELGTAVTVQAMVFGNRGEDSGTGVLFTRNPSTGEQKLYGDVMFNAQGEDVVAGTHATLPIADLDRRMPDVARELRRYAELLERHHADLADIEFTIEDGRLWMLQVRVGKRSPRAALRMAIDMAEDPTFPLSRDEAVRRVLPHLADPVRVFVRDRESPAPIARGLPASPGLATGSIVTTSDAAEAAAASGQAVILVRSETSPEDVRGMAKAAGVLTSRGGLASHAAVIARGWGIPAVVGAEGVHMGDDAVEIGGRVLRAGETITIDGGTGEIFLGELKGEWEVAPEVETLLGWASDLGVDVGSTPDAPGEWGHSDVISGDVTSDATPVDEPTAVDALRALAVKGATSLEQLSEALLAEPDKLKPIVDALVEDKVAELASGQVRLSAEGKLKASSTFADDRTSVGEDRSLEILEEFHALDGRMKNIVTAWQVRDVAGEQTLNDHADAAYDAGVLDDLAGLHAETADWLAPVAAAMPAFGIYRSRLTRALDLARTSDSRFVASPRVDSYHSVWFELHEHLIRLAGRKRSEVA